MKRSTIFIFLILFTFRAYSITSYKASYDLYGQTELGKIKFGIAEYELIVSNNVYVFTNSARTEKLMRAIYDYSINEISVGLIDSQNLKSDYYKIIENQGDNLTNSYEINMYPEDGYAKLNKEIIRNNFIKSNLEKLPDSGLILIAIEYGKDNIQ